MKIINRIVLIFVLLVSVLTLSGCADYVFFPESTTLQVVGFFHGLWHGIIVPFSFIISLFDSDVAIYAVYNNGGWYDFGFVIGVGGLIGSSSSKN